MVDTATSQRIGGTHFVALLRACAKNKDLCTGAKLHDDILREGLLSRCSDALVTMYATCGALATAKELLYMCKSRDVFAWTAVISGYAQKGDGEDALDCFGRMQRQGLSPDAVTLASILKACGSIGAADKGEKVHDEIIRQGLLGPDLVLGSALVDMYAKCCALKKAQQVLDDLPLRNVVSWSALIAGCTEQGQSEEALNCFEQMQCEGLSPDAVTYACVLKACGNIGAADKGERIHDEIVRRGLLEDNIVLGKAIVDMYLKCGAVEKALQVLTELPVWDGFPRDSFQAGYTDSQDDQSLDCSGQTRGHNSYDEGTAFVAFLRICAKNNDLHRGIILHDRIMRRGLLDKCSDALITMYARCGMLAEAEKLLRIHKSWDVLTWTSLISGYIQKGEGQVALDCFERMRDEGPAPDAVTFTCILKACGSVKAAVKGEKIHDEIVSHGLLGDDIVLGSALVDMYAKCGALAKAQKVLEALSMRNVVSWSALIAGYIQEGQGEQALNCYQEMQREGHSPDGVTLACILKACGSVGAADKGEKVHDEIIRQGLLGTDTVIGSALVDMYAKCGALTKAQKVLEELPVRNSVSWSALIAGYAQQGQGEHALSCYEGMQREGMPPDEVTLSSVLKACGSVGALDIGLKVHDEIVRQGLLGNGVLGNALVGMYAKCGALTKARQVLEELPARDVSCWSALIAGYAHHGKVEQAVNVLEQMHHQGISPDAAVHSSVLSACSVSGLVEEAQMYLTIMDTKYGLRPNPEHYTCLVDLMGRAGYLDKAAGVTQKIPSGSAVWSALLGACLKWGDVKVGRWAFECAVKADKGDAAAYILMSNIYAAAGMHEDADCIEVMRIGNKAWKESALDWGMGYEWGRFFQFKHAPSCYARIGIEV